MLIAIVVGENDVSDQRAVVQDARIYIERVNGPFLAAGGSPAEYRAGIERAIAKGWLWRHESRRQWLWWPEIVESIDLAVSAAPIGLLSASPALLAASASVRFVGIRPDDDSGS